MRPIVFRQSRGLRGKLVLPGDKSISHRAVMLAALSRGQTQITNFPHNDDCLATISAFKRLGVRFKIKKSALIVYGRGLRGLKKPQGPIFLSESGTTFRLFLGILAGQKFLSKLTAGPLLSVRPMRRVTEPLRRMGALLNCRVVDTISSFEEYPPVEIEGQMLKGIDYKMPVASAQVKSAILLAGLFAKGKTSVTEILKSRDHTERMLKLFKAQIKVSGKKISVTGARELKSPRQICIPGDISSAAFFMVAASIICGSEVIIENVSLNPTRIGAVKVLKRMQADIKIKPYGSKLTDRVEPAGDIIIKASRLKGVRIRKEEVPFLIDELPALMVAACFSCGKSIFEGIGELRVKETDRIRSMTENLRNMGANIEVRNENGREDMFITGAKLLRGIKVESFGDHRTAMSMIIAGLAATGETKIDDICCIDKSFPGFIRAISRISA